VCRGTDSSLSRWGRLHSGSYGDAYDDRWRRMEAAGKWPHGEADLVEWLGPESVLDAGCGTGRVAIELDRRGVNAVGVDLDPQMLAVARAKAPHMAWIQADLVDVTVDATGGVAAPGGGRRRFDAVVMAGNVMVFVAPGTEEAVVANMARHLRPGGYLIAGFQLGRSAFTFGAYDRAAAAAGLSAEHRWSTWDRAPYDGGGYAVHVHRA